MNELYSEQDLLSLNGQLRKRWIVLGILGAALLGLSVWSMIVRNQWLTMVLVFLLAAAAIFGIDFCCLPLLRSRKLLAAALTGRNHTEALEFERTEPDSSMVDGVACRSLLFLGEPDKHGSREQRFYLDAERPLPDFTPGETVTLKYTGRNIIGYEL